MSDVNEKIASFYAEVIAVFNMDEQLAKMQAQLKDFAARLGAITIPVRLAPVSQAAFEMAQLGALDQLGTMVSNNNKRNEANSGPDREYMVNELAASQYLAAKQKEQRQANLRNSILNAGSDDGLDTLGSGLSLLGFAKANAAFMAAFAAVDDLIQGAELDKQFAILKALIPNQQQYNQALQQLLITANLTGASIKDTAHGFIAFSNAAKNAGVDMATASKAFEALNIGIAATGSNQQAYRIYSDFLSQVMNVDKVSLAKIAKTDLGRYLDIVKLLENLPQFKGDSLSQLQEAFNKLSKAELMNLISTALLSGYQKQAAVGSNTLAGNFNKLENSLELLGAEIVQRLTPALNVLLIGFRLLADGATAMISKFNFHDAAINFALPGLGDTALKGISPTAILKAEGESLKAGLLKFIHYEGPMPPSTLVKQPDHPALSGTQQTNHSPMQVNVVVQNQSSNPIKASATLSNPQGAKSFARSY